MLESPRRGASWPEGQISGMSGAERPGLGQRSMMVAGRAEAVRQRRRSSLRRRCRNAHDLYRCSRSEAPARARWTSTGTRALLVAAPVHQQQIGTYEVRTRYVRCTYEFRRDGQRDVDHPPGARTEPARRGPSAPAAIRYVRCTYDVRTMYVRASRAPVAALASASVRESEARRARRASWRGARCADRRRWRARARSQRRVSPVRCGRARAGPRAVPRDRSRRAAR